jgi:hypothetical protein
MGGVRSLAQSVRAAAAIWHEPAKASDQLHVMDRRCGRSRMDEDARKGGILQDASHTRR